MADKDDFHFEEEETDDSFDMTGGFGAPGSHGEEEDETFTSTFEPAKKRSLSRPLLLVLLLLVLAAAAGYFFLGDSTAPVTKVPAPVVKKQAVPQPVAARTPVEKLAMETAKAPAAPAPTEAPLDKGVVEETISQKEVAVVEPPAAPAVEKTARTEGPETKPVAKTETEAELQKTVAESPSPVATSGEYYLQGGAFLVHENLAGAEKTVRALGFEPHLVQSHKKAKMTRLRVGYYSPQEARNKMAEIKALAPDAFLLRDGDRVGVYVGSYYDLDKGRRYADLLYQKGLRVEEEYVDIVLPMTILTFGDFPDMATARKASERARSKGLDVLIVQRH